jgi:hypothetical protein
LNHSNARCFIAVTMDTIKLIYYRALLTAALVGKTGEDFQEFFVRVAKAKWADEFEPIRPYGNRGDRKCDGRLTSDGTFFQCYGPYAGRETKIHEKIDKDFDGALAEWGDDIKEWVFVINDRAGLDAASDEKLGELRKSHPEIRFRVFGPTEFEEFVFSLPDSKIASLFGIGIHDLDPRRWEFTFPDIDEIIRSLDLPHYKEDEKFSLPPPDKIEQNNLSAAVAQLIRTSDIFVRDVQDYFAKQPDVALETRVASFFRGLYDGLKANGLDPDTIFFRIVDQLKILSQAGRKREAGFALITYFFRGCVIFESTSEVA